MFDTLGFETLTAPQAAVFFGLILGAAFGLMAEASRFCLRRGLVAGPDRRAALGVWAAGLATALAGTQGAVAAGLVSFEAHRFHAADLPLAAILAGGALFGAGMVLARGCLSRLTVLSATGNLRALTALLVAALAAQATLVGALAPLRTALGQATLPLGEAARLSALPGGALVWTAAGVAAALALAARSGARPRDLALGAAIGLLVPLGWLGTGLVLVDDFDPIPLESLSFTRPAADGLFWVAAASAIAPTFSAGLLGGTLAGAFAAAALGGRLAWAGFDTTPRTGASLAGGVLMGVGGVLAGGCTIGAGLSGVPTLGVAALLALAAIVAGATATDAALSGRSRSATGGSSATPRPRPAA